MGRKSHKARKYGIFCGHFGVKKVGRKWAESGQKPIFSQNFHKILTKTHFKSGQSPFFKHKSGQKIHHHFLLNFSQKEQKIREIAQILATSLKIKITTYPCYEML